MLAAAIRGRDRFWAVMAFVMLAYAALRIRADGLALDRGSVLYQPLLSRDDLDLLGEDD